MVELRSRPHVVSEIKAKTRAEMFKNVKVGDVLVFSTELSYKSGASGGGTYATYIRVDNLTSGEHSYKSQSELVGILRRLFELKEAE